MILLWPTNGTGVVEKRRTASVPEEESSSNRPPGRNWAVAGVVVGALAFVVLPFLLGPLGILFGLIGFAKGARKLGKIAVGVSVFSLVLGSALFVLLQSLVNLG